jgi:hypothetical protein
VLYCFTGSSNDGFIPGYGDLLFDPSGSIYLTTIQGGINGKGTVFELTPGGSWTESILFNMTASSSTRPAIFMARPWKAVSNRLMARFTC